MKGRARRALQLTMRVAVTDFIASYSIASQQRGGAFSPETSLDEHFRGAALPALDDPLAATTQLLQDVPYNREKLQIICGASKGDLSALPQWATNGDFGWTPDHFAYRLASALGSRGAVLSPNSACATSAHSIALAAQSIRFGAAEMALAGGIEWPQPELILAAYRNMHALSKTGLMRPFDVRRDGFIPASGFGFLLLESEESALRRGAHIHGYVSGWSMKCDATHMTAMCPSGDSIARAIEEALGKAGKPSIDYINAHGTATKLNDAIESRAIKSVFGTGVPVSSTKPLTGHLLGAAGAVEAAICLTAMCESYAPPTLNLEEEDRECDLDYIPLQGRKKELKSVLSLNYGFGGHIGALVFERPNQGPQMNADGRR